MRIISKFHDYYDSALGYGIDTDLVYVRHTEEYCREVIRAKATIDNLRDRVIPVLPAGSVMPRFSGDAWNTRLPENMFLATSFVVLFCGKAYRGMRVLVREPEEMFGHITKHCYSIDDARKLVEHYGSTSDLERFDKDRKPMTDLALRRSRNPFTHAWMNAFFTSVSENTSQVEDRVGKFLAEEKLPIVIYDSDNDTAIANPCLKEWEFYKAVDAYTAFQEISMFVGGVLSGTSPDMVEISDPDRIHKHGFDQWSFRKPPESKTR